VKFASGAVFVDGLDEVNKALEQYPKKLEKGGIRKGTRAGAKIVHADLLRRAPHDSGDLRASFKVRTMVKRKGRSIKRRSHQIGHAVANKEGHLFKGDQFYGAFLELGTGDRFIKGRPELAAFKKSAPEKFDLSGGKRTYTRRAYRGFIVARAFKFIRPALFENKDAVRRA
jgi:HK97 gp10 family phage protein